MSTKIFKTTPESLDQTSAICEKSPKLSSKLWISLPPHDWIIPTQTNYTFKISYPNVAKPK